MSDLGGVADGLPEHHSQIRRKQAPVPLLASWNAGE